jgi:hypothetical protein
MQATTTGGQGKRFDGRWIGLIGLSITLLAAAALLGWGAVPASGRHVSAAPAATTAPWFILGDVDGHLHAPHSTAPSGVEPLFLIGDVDGVAHQQGSTASVAGACGGSDSPLFLGGDRDGLASSALDATIPTNGCRPAQR